MNFFNRGVVIFLLGLALVPARGVEPVPDVSSRRSRVYVVPIQGTIEPALLYVIRRGLIEAESHPADAVVFVMDTPGGRLDAAREIVRLIQNVQVPTYTFVEKDAFSAGAIIALATQHIYMAPGSVIGDAFPILVSPFGGVQEVPEGVEEKQVSAVAALVRAAAEQGGHNKELAEAMVRRDMELRIGDRLIKPAGQLLTLTNEEAAESIGENGVPLLSSGTVASVPELLDRIGLADAEILELRVTGAERVARVIAALAPLLLIIGLLGIYVESRTPGIGIAGALGGLALALFFWGHHIAGMAGSEDLLIFTVGLVLLLVEVFFIPDFGLVGMAGLLMMGLGMLMAMVQRLPGGPALPAWPELQWPLMKLALTFAGTIIGALLLGRFLPRGSIFQRLSLESSTTRALGFSASDDFSAWVGKQGESVSSLRPAGTVLIDGRRMDVVTRGEFVSAGRSVRIVEAHGARLVVEPVVAPEPEAS